MKENCIFCKIISGDIPSVTAYENDEFKVIFDVSPATKGHVLVLPKEHYDNIFEIPDELEQKAFLLAKKIASALKEILGCDGINIVQNNGIEAGQTVFHLHIHIIPRYKGEENKATCKKVSWNQTEMDKEEMVKVAEKIKEIIK